MIGGGWKEVPVWPDRGVGLGGSTIQINGTLRLLWICQVGLRETSSRLPQLT